MPHPKRSAKIADSMTCIICGQEIIPTTDDPVPDGYESWPLGSHGVPLKDTLEKSGKCCSICFQGKVMMARMRHQRNRKEIFGR